jgi:ankyrin repeat protein
VPLSIAILNNDKDMVAALLDIGAEVNSSANILAFAIKEKVGVELIELLLKNGIEVNVPSYLNEKKNTYPLSMAVIRKKIELVKMLLDYGADVDSA